MITINNLNYKKGRKQILKNINLKIEDNTFNIIVGENGCGKTTLLKIIARAINKKKVENTFKDMFFMCDHFVLPKNKYVKDFLYNAFNYFRCGIDIDNMIYELEIPNKKIKELSKGNYKKVAFILSLLSGADLLLYDEILDGLDPEIVKKVIKYLKESNKTIIVVTHFIKSFRYLKYNLIKMKEGRIIEE